MFNKEKIFIGASDYLAGTCMTTAEDSLRIVAEFQEAGVEITDTLVEEFLEYLEKIDQHECKECGWWVYPGEICECQDEEDICNDCYNSLDDCTCDEVDEDEDK